MGMFASVWSGEGGQSVGLPASGKRIFNQGNVRRRRASQAFPVQGMGFAIEDINVGRYDPQGFMVIEGQRQNQVINPRFEGGTANAAPSNHAYSGRSGVGVSGFGYRMVQDLPVLDISLGGTATADGWITSVFTPPVAVAPGDWVTTSFAVSVNEGEQLTSSGTLYHEQRDASQASLATSSRGFTPTPGAPFGSDVCSFTTQITNASAAFLYQYWRYRYPNGATINAKFSIFSPQVEKAGSQTSLILPPVGTQAVSTRAEDRVFTDFTGQKALAIRCKIPDLPKAGESQQILFQLDNGTDGNRFVCWIEPGGLVNCLVVNPSWTSIGMGLLAADEVLDLLVRFTDTGLTIHRAGVPVGSFEGAFPSPLTTARFGNRADWGQGGNMRLGKVDIYSALALFDVPQALDALKRN